MRNLTLGCRFFKPNSALAHVDIAQEAIAFIATNLRSTQKFARFKQLHAHQ